MRGRLRFLVVVLAFLCAWGVDVGRGAAQAGHSTEPGWQPAAVPRLHRVPYEEGQSIPPGGVVVERSGRGLWIPGITIFAATYGATVFTALYIREFSTIPARRDGAAGLYVPVLGPLLYIPFALPTYTALFVVDALVQGGSLTMLLVGFLMKKRELVFFARGPNQRELTILPTVSGGGVGCAVRF
jgi:hypothetical protein